MAVLLGSHGNDRKTAEGAEVGCRKDCEPGQLEPASFTGAHCGQCELLNGRFYGCAIVGPRKEYGRYRIPVQRSSVAVIQNQPVAARVCHGFRDSEGGRSIFLVHTKLERKTASPFPGDFNGSASGVSADVTKIVESCYLDE
jgi:hypothetical protein